MKHYATSAIFFAGLLTTFSSQAADLVSRGYVEGSLAAGLLASQADSKIANVDALGFDARAQIETGSNLGMRASITRISGKEPQPGGLGIEVATSAELLRLGATVLMDYPSKNIQLVGEAAFVSLGRESNVGSPRDTGFDVGVGLEDRGYTSVIWSAELGGVKIGDAVGGRFQASIGYRLAENVAILSRIQGYAFQIDKPTENRLGLSAATLGLRVSF